MKVRFDSQAFIIVLMFLDILLDHIHLVVQYQQVVHSNVPTKKLVNTCRILLRERRKSKLQFGDGKRTVRLRKLQINFMKVLLVVQYNVDHWYCVVNQIFLNYEVKPQASPQVDSHTDWMLRINVSWGSEKTAVFRVLEQTYQIQALSALNLCFLGLPSRVSLSVSTGATLACRN